MLRGALIQQKPDEIRKTIGIWLYLGTHSLERIVKKRAQNPIIKKSVKGLSSTMESPWVEIPRQENSLVVGGWISASGPEQAKEICEPCQGKPLSWVESLG